MLLLWLACARSMPPSEADAAAQAAVPGLCQVCFFQREGELDTILRRAVRGKSVPLSEVEFGHCFACVRCPGEDAPSGCRGWSPASQETADFSPQPGRVFDEQDEIWTRADCIPVLPSQASPVWRFMQDYGEPPLYQVINRGGRSCLGYCTDVADALGVTSVRWAGDLTVPGALRFPDAPLQLAPRTPQAPMALMDALVPASAAH